MNYLQYVVIFPSRIIFLVTICFLTSCVNNDSQNMDNAISKSIANDSIPHLCGDYTDEEIGDDKSFDDTTFYQLFIRFLNVIKNSDTTSFNAMVSPDNGLFIIESNGAMPQMKRVFDIGQFRKISNGKSVFEENNFLECIPELHFLPEADCDFPSGYSRNGCFIKKTNELAGSNIWKYCSMKKEEEAIAENMALSVTVTAIHTALFKCYFTIKEGQWYLLFLDLRPVCQA